jgi:predicted ATPase
VSIICVLEIILDKPRMMLVRKGVPGALGLQSVGVSTLSWCQRASGGASSATELAGLAVHMYGEKEASESRGPKAAYEELIASGKLRQDARQENTVMELERVYDDLLASRAASGTGSGLTLVEASSSSSSKGGSWWKSMFSTSEDAPKEGVKGLYMYGGVGCGKTMLMDMFASSVPRDLNVRDIH